MFMLRKIIQKIQFIIKYKLYNYKKNKFVYSMYKDYG